MVPTTKRVLTLQSINRNILATKYAVRGELPIRADQITRVGRSIPVMATHLSIGTGGGEKRTQEATI